MLKVENLFAGYNGADVICNINFCAEKGESLCVLGPNGCGKSTLLKSLSRIIDYRGNIFMDNEDISGVTRKVLAKKIALLNQNAQVYFPYTVYDTVSMGRYAYLQGLIKNPCAEDKLIIENIMKKLDIWDIKDCMIDELSGGTLQRVFLAKTLAQTPDVILLDEPANHLDLKHQIELLNFLRSWVNENKKILISVFHDLNLARQFGDTAFIMKDGKAAAYGKIGDIMRNDIINSVYGIDIRKFMKESFEKWK